MRERLAVGGAPPPALASALLAPPRTPATPHSTPYLLLGDPDQGVGGGAPLPPPHKGTSLEVRSASSIPARGAAMATLTGLDPAA